MIKKLRQLLQGRETPKPKKVTKFNQLFPVQKPIIGMIHLAGASEGEKVNRAIEDFTIFEEEGIDGAIIEDYHTRSLMTVQRTVTELCRRRNKVIIGVNYLQDPILSFPVAQQSNLGFVQIDSVVGPEDTYKTYREIYPMVTVLGGVGFKYAPETGKTAQQDLEQGRSRCDAVVTTGSGTGIETPLEKLQQYKEILGNFPLIVGAGVNPSNAYDQLSIADAVIVGSSLKPDNNTQLPVDRSRVRDLVSIIKSLR